MTSAMTPLVAEVHAVEVADGGDDGGAGGGGELGELGWMIIIARTQDLLSVRRIEGDVEVDLEAVVGEADVWGAGWRWWRRGRGRATCG